MPQIGYLITAFAVAMAAGGPVLTAALMRLAPKTALMLLFAVFLAGNVLAATATGYGTMLVTASSPASPRRRSSASASR